jgi:hypothetical protein
MRCFAKGSKSARHTGEGFISLAFTVGAGVFLSAAWSLPRAAPPKARLIDASSFLRESFVPGSLACLSLSGLLEAISVLRVKRALAGDKRGIIPLRFEFL